MVESKNFAEENFTPNFAKFRKHFVSTLAQGQGSMVEVGAFSVRVAFAKKATVKPRIFYFILNKMLYF
jgi:hypothetical protein